MLVPGLCEPEEDASLVCILQQVVPGSYSSVQHFDAAIAPVLIIAAQIFVQYTQHKTFTQQTSEVADTSGQ